jgi:hypothetical protein
VDLAQAVRVWTVISEAMRSLQSAPAGEGGDVDPASPRPASRTRSVAASLWSRGAPASSATVRPSPEEAAAAAAVARDGRLRQLQAAHDLLVAAFGEELAAWHGGGGVTVTVVTVAEGGERVVMAAQDVPPHLMEHGSVRLVTAADGAVLVEAATPRRHPPATPASGLRPTLHAVDERTPSSDSDDEAAGALTALALDNDPTFGARARAPGADEAAVTAAAVAQVLPPPARGGAASHHRLASLPLPLPDSVGSLPPAAAPPSSPSSPQAPRRGLLGSMAAAFSGAAASFRSAAAALSGGSSRGAEQGAASRLPALPPLPPLRALLLAHERACEA